MGVGGEVSNFCYPLRWFVITHSWVIEACGDIQLRVQRIGGVVVRRVRRDV